MPHELTLTFAPLDVDAHRSFLLGAHRERSKLTFGAAFDDEKIEREIGRERGRSTGVFLDGNLIGICDVEQRSRDDRTFGWVHFFYLAPSFRGQALGRQLIEYAANFCRERGLTTLYLRVGATNESAYRFYSRNGFVRAEHFDKPGEYGFKMPVI